jgi:ribosomal-protein-alanine N-acetyltransferase
MIAEVGPAALDCLRALRDVCFADAWSRDFLADLLAGAGVRAWIDDDCAFVILRVVAGEAEILSLGCRPEKRRQGLARALLQHAIGVARQAGATRLFLEVAADNNAARALYVALDFAEVGRRPRYYPSGIDALTLARQL